MNKSRTRKSISRTRRSISRTSKSRTRKTSKSRTRKRKYGGIIRVPNPNIKEKEPVDPFIYRGGTSERQAIIFNKHTWNIPSAKKWLKKHNITPIKSPHLTNNFIRFRLEDPTKFKSYATIKTKDDIDIIIGYK